MANKRNLKKSINEICKLLLAQTVGEERVTDEKALTDVEGILRGIAFLQRDALRLCNKAPRKSGKTYFAKQLPMLKERILEIYDSINNLP